MSRQIIERYVSEWTRDIVDYTPRVQKMHQLLKAGKAEEARKLLPPEKVYPVPPSTARQINLTG